MSRTEELVYWITERERMRVCKEAAAVMGAKHGVRYGWSDDPHMGLVRYCNVRREDDKVTKWLAQHWRPKHHAVWEIVLARMVNYIPSLEQILTGWEQHPKEDPVLRAAYEMKVERELGKKIWTSAYTISTCGQTMDKVDYVMGVVQDVRECSSWPWELGGPITLQRTHWALTQTKGLGSFLAAQVIADLKNTAGHPLQDASDWHTWAAPGPGSLRGLEAYFGRPVRPSSFAHYLAQVWQDIKPLLPENLHDLHMQDLQNCMCEFSKYIRVKEGNGHVRNKYAAG